MHDCFCFTVPDGGDTCKTYKDIVSKWAEEKRFPTLASVKTSLKFAADKIHKENTPKEDSENSQNSTKNSPPKKRAKGESLFSLIQQNQEAMQLMSPSSQAQVENEVSNYLSEKALSPEECPDPIKYWKNNAHRFPTLEKLAKQVLGMPASSGGVERLFSVAGAIARSRRARLETKTIEKILMLRQFLRNEDKMSNIKQA